MDDSFAVAKAQEETLEPAQPEGGAAASSSVESAQGGVPPAENAWVLAALTTFSVPETEWEGVEDSEAKLEARYPQDS